MADPHDPRAVYASTCCRAERFGLPLGARMGQRVWLNLHEISRHLLSSARQLLSLAGSGHSSRHSNRRARLTVLGV
jgi:hypothetical protein